MMRKEFVITNDQGLHARPATTLVSKANQFKSSDIRLIHEGETVDLKSIMGVLSLGINRGALIEIEVEGGDEAETMDAISKHIKELNIK